METPCSTFREQALAWLTSALGSPMVVPMGNGASVYRWILARPRGQSVYVTLNSPGLPGVAQLLISDPRQKPEPLTSLTLRSLTDLDREVARVLRQWKEGLEPAS
jgi:hypothetical protein